MSEWLSVQRWQHIRLPEHDERHREIAWLRHISVPFVQLCCNQVQWGVKHNICIQCICLYKSITFSADLRTLADAYTQSACLIARPLNVLRLKQTDFCFCHTKQPINSGSCCRIWRPQQGSPGLHVAVSACGSMVGPASLERSGAGRRAWSFLPLLRDLPFYQSSTHPQCCRRCPENQTGKSSSTSRLRPAHWHAVVSPRSRPTSLRWVRHSSAGATLFKIFVIPAIFRAGLRVTKSNTTAAIGVQTLPDFIIVLHPILLLLGAA